MKNVDRKQTINIRSADIHEAENYNETTNKVWKSCPTYNRKEVCLRNAEQLILDNK